MTLAVQLAQPTQSLGVYASEKRDAETGDSTGGGCHYTLSASDLMGSAHSPLVAGTGRDSASGSRPSGARTDANVVAPDMIRFHGTLAGTGDPANGTGVVYEITP
jgi:hypothetical protein